VKQGLHLAQALLLVEQGPWSGGGHLLPGGPSWGLSTGFTLQENIEGRHFLWEKRRPDYLVH